MTTQSIAETQRDRAVDLWKKLTDETSKSALLEETERPKRLPPSSPFSPFFGSTWSVIDSQFENPDSGGGTPLLSDNRLYWWSVPVEQEPHGVVTDDNSARIVLLARKYVAEGTISDEQNARLAIVTERVRKLLPAVTIQEFEVLEDVLARVRDISESDRKIRLSLGLDPSKRG